LDDLRAVAATEIDRRLGIKAAQAFLGNKSIVTTEVYLRDLRVPKIRPLERKKA
jgi:hypothetical protein